MGHGFKCSHVVFAPFRLMYSNPVLDEHGGGGIKGALIIKMLNLGNYFGQHSL